MSVQRISSFKTFTELKGQQHAAKLHEEGKSKRAEIVSKIGAALEEMGVTSLKELDEEKRNTLIATIFEDEAEEIEKDINDLGEPKKEDEKDAEKVQAANESLITEGTRSQIGKIGKDGKITSVYVHYDGYPENMVPLLKNYKNAKTVDQLVTLGKFGISYLDKKIGEQPMDFNNPDKGVTLFYGRDRNEKRDMTTKADVKSVAKYLKQVANNSGAEYAYLFDERDGKWYMADTYEDKELKPVSESLLVEGFSKPSSSFMSRANGLVKTASMKTFKKSAEDMINDLTDDGFEADEVIEWLAFELYDLFGESLDVNEGAHGMATKLLQGIVNGDSSKAEDFKMSKELAQHFIDWIRTSPYGKKNGNLPLAMLVKASFNWGIERGLDPKLKDELKSLKDSVKESVEVEEGNEFSLAVKKAKEAGEKEFEFDGKTYKVEEDKAEEIEADINDLGEVEKEDQTDAEKVQADLYEARSINKIQNEWTKVTAEMKSTVDAWKKAEGDAKAPLLAKLKELTAKKNALEVELNDAISDKDKDLELVVSEGNAFVYAAAKAKQEGKDEFEVNGKKYKVTLKKHALTEDEEVSEAMFKSKDFDKTLVTYAVDTRADEIYVISVEKVLHSSFPTMSNVPDKRFHGMFGMMLEENWLKQYDKLPKVGDILPAPKKDKAFEAIELNEEDIKSDEQFTEYAMTVLKDAFKDEFDEAKAKEVVDGILKKCDGDYGAAVGMLTSSLG
jgi:hypothetical protein